MRLRSFVPIAGLSAFLAVAIAAPAATPKAYSCGATKVTILLWPHGHKAIRSVHFPAARTPNIQVYRYDPNFRGGNFLFYADARGNVHPVKELCGTGASRPATAIANSRRSRAGVRSRARSRRPRPSRSTTSSAGFACAAGWPTPRFGLQR